MFIYTRGFIHWLIARRHLHSQPIIFSRTLCRRRFFFMAGHHQNIPTPPSSSTCHVKLCTTVLIPVLYVLSG